MIAVDVQNLTKVYRIYRSPWQRVKEIMLRRPFHTPFAALSEVTFSVPHGNTFGIIGENGAGKSTLLKILARTLKATEGTVSTTGRTAALLELGAGFNPELSGEENIYLNGYLMGLSRQEIDEKRKDIIEFSELGDFIDRPVKTYSSGMYVRLAFSIATSVDPDILIVDEALSVGDEYFQRKCITRMISFRERGKTILFCSHSLYHIQELCGKVLWLHKGRVRSLGDTGRVLTDYQNYERGREGVLKGRADELIKSEESVKSPVKIVGVRLLDKGGTETEALRTGEPVTLSFSLRCTEKGLRGHIGFGIYRNDEVMTFGTMTCFDGLPAFELQDGQEFGVAIPALTLLSGLYSIVLAVADEHALHPFDMFRTKCIPVTHSGKEFGMSYLEHTWLLP